MARLKAIIVKILDKAMWILPITGLMVGLVGPFVALRVMDPEPVISMRDVVIYCAALLATGGWLLSNRMNRSLARKDHAMRLLLHLREDYVDELKTEIYESIGKGDEPDTEKAQRLLGLYEFIAVSVINGTADEQMIRESQQYIFNRLRNGLEDLIEAHQENFAPEVYENFVDLGTKWDKDDNAMIDKAKEKLKERRRIRREIAKGP